MSNLILDHIFCFCEGSAEREVKVATDSGFRLTPKKQHQDQGTANHCILFRENYLEFIFINSEVEARSNPLRLDRRAKWKETGASPFGVGLRGLLNEDDLEQFWEYKPTYWPNGSILVHKSNEEHPELPLIFVLNPCVKPAEKNIDGSLLTHRSSSTEIKRVNIQGPSNTWPSLSPVSGIHFSDNKATSMKIFINGNIETPIAFNELISMESMIG